MILFRNLQTTLQNRAFLAVFLLSWAVFLVGSNRVGVPPVDANMRADMARYIVETGVWYPPYFDGGVIVDHPPLCTWLIAVAFKIFGVIDFAAMFPYRLAAALCIILVFLCGRRGGLSDGWSLAAATIFATTRDFVIISAQGGIEPVFTLFSLSAFYFALPGGRPYAGAALAGFSVILAAFAKGPPALMAFVFIPFMFLVHREKWLKRSLIYLASVIAGAALWYLWIRFSGLSWYWLRYLNEQVLGSAVGGRGGTQTLDPFYFVRILGTQYWPWLPFLFYAVWVALQKKIGFLQLALLYGLGFFCGFSLVKWKFWYYIAPAFPLFALAIAAAISQRSQEWPKLTRLMDNDKFPTGISLFSLFVVFVLSVFPVTLDGDYVPEVRAFRSAIVNSAVPGPVRFMAHPSDGLNYVMNGLWYFHRHVERVADAEKFRPPAEGSWVITSAAQAEKCTYVWCRNPQFKMISGKSALFLVKP